jgi:hypothetical protein
LRPGPDRPQRASRPKAKGKAKHPKSEQRRAVDQKRSGRRAGSSPEVANGDVDQNRPAPEGHGPRRAAVLLGREDLPLACRAVLSAFAAAGVSKCQAKESKLYAAAQDARDYAGL